jgi:amino-acid N-acetyltransferase
VQVSLVDDIMMLHGMGIRLILVLGAAPQMNEYLRLRGAQPRFVKGYRVTDELGMEAAMEAAGFNRILFEALLSKARPTGDNLHDAMEAAMAADLSRSPLEALLSMARPLPLAHHPGKLNCFRAMQGPPLPVVRRHRRTHREFRFAAAIKVASGNYTAAQRRGVVEGVNHGYAGFVRFVNAAAIEQQLNNGSAVLLSNLGYSAGGVLRCSASPACKFQRFLL